MADQKLIPEDHPHLLAKKAAKEAMEQARADRDGSRGRLVEAEEALAKAEAEFRRISAGAPTPGTPHVEAVHGPFPGTPSAAVVAAKEPPPAKSEAKKK